MLTDSAASPPFERARIFTLLASSSLTVMAGAVVAPSLPGIELAYADTAHVDLLARLVLTLPALAIAFAGPLAGWAVDRGGRRRTLLVSLVLFGLAGSTGAYLPGLHEVMAGRVVLGLAVSGLMTAATTLIADLYSGAARGRLLSWQAAFMGVGGSIFLLAGGALADVSWRAPFVLYLASLLLVPAVVVYLPEPRPGSGSEDATAASAPRPGEGDRARSPWPTLLALFAASTVSMLAFYLVPVQGPFLLSARLGAHGLGIGAAVGVMAVVSAFGSLLAPRVLDRFEHVGTLAITFALVATGELLLVGASSWPGVMIAMGLTGLGLGMVMPNLSLWVTRLAPLSVRGRALGGLTTSLFLGQFLSPIVAGPLTAAGPETGSARAFLAGGALAAACAMVSAIAALRGRRRADRPRAAQGTP